MGFEVQTNPPISTRKSDRVVVNRIELIHLKRIRTLGEKDNYMYIGILEAFTSNRNERYIKEYL